jgi:hypothetical protein
MNAFEQLQSQLLADVGERRIELSESVRPQTPKSRWRMRVGLAGGGLVAAGVAATAIALSSSAGLAQRAYAHTEIGSGLATWSTTIDVYDANGKITTRQSEQGWSDGSVTRTVLSTTGAAHSDSTERVTSAAGEEVRVNGGPISHGSGLTDLERLLGPGDPVEAFRRAYSDKRLVKVSENAYRVAPRTGAPALTYVIDPTTAEPVTLTTVDGPATTVTHFNSYTIVTKTPQTQALLRLH